MHAKLLQSCLSLCDPVNCSQPDSSVHEILPGKNTGGGGQFLSQRTCPSQGLNPRLLHLLHRSWTLSPLSHQGRPPPHLHDPCARSMASEPFWKTITFPLFYNVTLSQSSFRICFVIREHFWNFLIKLITHHCFAFNRCKRKQKQNSLNIPETFILSTSDSLTFQLSHWWLFFHKMGSSVPPRMLAMQQKNAPLLFQDFLYALISMCKRWH